MALYNFVHEYYIVFAIFDNELTVHAVLSPSA